ncbi:MAG: 4Fe-4S dicluster domain-containing protein [Candidatus Krumholzibacteriota bacterium]|nr:4Fe-4S dicluster domain-containing protein [Candidatus Krumholzibacteriota bacterium]
MSRILEEAITVVSAEHCKGCGLCVQACPQAVLALMSSFNSKGYHPAHYVGEGCTGCGMCFYACPEPAAITVYKKGAEYPDQEGR